MSASNHIAVIRGANTFKQMGIQTSIGKEDDVSDYVQMAVFTSAKCAQIVKILRQGRQKTSRIPGVMS